MERLWTPWRLAYITGAGGAAPPGCIFCEAADAASPRDSDLVLVRRPLSYVILNRYPYNNGHLMVVARRHVAALADMTRDEIAEIFGLTRHAEMALAEAYHPQGINVGINVGR